MRFIRMKIKNLVIRDIEQDLIMSLNKNGFALGINLPLPDIYLKKIH